MVNGTNASLTVNQSATTPFVRSPVVIRTLILGENFDIDERSTNGMPEWFFYLVFCGLILCFLSYVAWIICALCFFKRDRKCTHTLHLVVDQDTKPAKSKKKENVETPVETPNEGGTTGASFTTPLTPERKGNRSSRRSSRKDGESKRSIRSAKSSSKSPASRKSESKNSERSGKSGRKEGGKEVKILMGDEEQQGSRIENVGFFQKVFSFLEGR
uniref:Uncharacterized protein n=1 Tax=Caenorhabditis tropicalis TaxID=1561998 RepID=A0A1I7UT28_9PELO